MVRKQLFFAIFLISLIACQNANNVSKPIDFGTPTRYEGQQKPQIAELVAKGSLTIKNISALTEKLDEAQPFGEVVALHIKNETNQTQT